MTAALDLRARLSLPAVCAPMFLVSTPALVREACLAGLVGAMPRHNARSLAEFEAWLIEIGEALSQARERDPAARIGPVAVNLSARLSAREFDDNLHLCQRHGVEIVINATGNPAELTRRAHDRGLLVWADAVNLRFAEKAISVGVDGITAIGAGGGGHSGMLSHLTLVGAIRQRFAGTLVMGGAVASGAAIRAAEVLGADLAYLGTRFIATREAGAPEAYKRLLVEGGSADLRYTDRVTGVAANWLLPSLVRSGVDPDRLAPPQPEHAHLPPTARPWVNLWSAGQGIDQIHDVPSVRDLVERLRREYDTACAVPAFAHRP